jgi:acyl-CoA synthetase (AMP-forming)/AMP-acid ligase II
MNAGTISEFLEAGADDAPALNAPGGTALSYRGLRALVAEVAKSLASQGIGPGDRVGIVLDNGPEMAAAFLAIGSAATAAPLNPTYRADEFEFYLNDLNAKLLVAAAEGFAGGRGRTNLGVDRASDATSRTRSRHVLIGLRGGSTERSAGRAATPDDIALVLHTSGTTSRPKIVPLAHKNIAASAANIRNTLALTANDRGLVIMPLFHIHGLIAALSAPLSAGGEVCCSPGFNALKFFSWLDEVKPTWYTGVPTMHQAMLLRAPGNQESVKNHRLRFIRSSSSALRATVIAELGAYSAYR